MADKNLWQQLTEGLTDAIADIRQKVVEEPFFGRAVTEGPEAAPLWSEQQTPAMGSSTHEREISQPALDLDFDR